MGHHFGKHKIVGLAGILLSIGAIICSCVSVSSIDWEVYKLEVLGVETSAHLGLLEWKTCVEDKCSDTMSWKNTSAVLSTDLVKKYEDAGIGALLCIIVAMVCYVVSILHFAVGFLGHRRWFLKFTTWFPLAAALMAVLGWILWLALKPAPPDGVTAELSTGFVFAILAFVCALCLVPCAFLATKHGKGGFVHI